MLEHYQISPDLYTYLLEFKFTESRFIRRLKEIIRAEPFYTFLVVYSTMCAILIPIYLLSFFARTCKNHLNIDWKMYDAIRDSFHYIDNDGFTGNFSRICKEMQSSNRSLSFPSLFKPCGTLAVDHWGIADVTPPTNRWSTDLYLYPEIPYGIELTSTFTAALMAMFISHLIIQFAKLVPTQSKIIKTLENIFITINLMLGLEAIFNFSHLFDFSTNTPAYNGCVRACNEGLHLQKTIGNVTYTIENPKQITQCDSFFDVATTAAATFLVTPVAFFASACKKRWDKKGKQAFAALEERKFEPR